MRKRTGLAVIFVMAAVSIGFGATAVSASHCDPARFCAFDDNSYGHPKELQSGAAAGSDHVDVGDNAVNSAKNLTGNWWCAVESGGWPDQTIFQVAPNTNAASFYPHNNQTDHFYVRSSGC